MKKYRYLIILIVIFLTLTSCATNTTLDEIPSSEVEESSSLESSEVKSSEITESQDNPYKVTGEYLDDKVLFGVSYNSVFKTTINSYIVCLDDKYGVLNLEGNIIIPIIYRRIDLQTSEDRDLTNSDDYQLNISISNRTYILADNDFLGMASEEGTFILDMEHDYISQHFINGFGGITKNNKSGCIDINGNIVISPIYEYLQEFPTENTLFACRDEKYGYINLDNEIIIDFKYKNAMPIRQGIALVYDEYQHYWQEDNLYSPMIETANFCVFGYSYLDKNGNILFKSPNTYISYDNIYNFDVLKIQDIMGLFNKGEVLLGELEPTISIQLDNHFYYELVYINEKMDYRWVKTEDEAVDVVVWDDELNYRVLSIKEYLNSFSS